jgi:hypothetical protein
VGNDHHLVIFDGILVVEEDLMAIPQKVPEGEGKSPVVLCVRLQGVEVRRPFKLASTCHLVRYSSINHRIAFRGVK